MEQCDFKIPKTTHRISVRSKLRGVTETKGFSISAHGKTFDELFLLVQTFAEKELPTLLYTDIVITSAPLTRSSHTILLFSLQDGGAAQAISVQFPYHSATEIARELQKFLCAGNTEF